MSNTVRQTLDATAIAVAGASWVDWLPSVAAGLSILWLLIRIWESDTIRGWTGRLKDN